VSDEVRAWVLPIGAGKDRQKDELLVEAAALMLLLIELRVVRKTSQNSSLERDSRAAENRISAARVGTGYSQAV